MVVLRAVALHGPVTLPQLNRSLEIPRASIWRALDALREAGWVRMRLGDSAFELSHGTFEVLGAAQASVPEVAQAVDYVQSMDEAGELHIQIGMFTDTGVYKIVETTQKSGYNSRPLSLTDDLIAIAGQMQLDSPTLVRHIRAYIERSSCEERQVILSGEHSRQLQTIREQAVLWGEDGDTACIPFPCAAKMGLAIELRPKSQTKKSMLAFADLVAGLAILIKARRLNFANIPG